MPPGMVEWKVKVHGVNELRGTARGRDSSTPVATQYQVGAILKDCACVSASHQKLLVRPQRA
jgi:hypothetical protein